MANALSGLDAISELPDAVLHLILSSLSTREAVQTSVLSSRWRHVWSGVPALDFNQEEFSSQELFRAIVQRVLSVRDVETLVTSFRLAVSDGVDHSYVFQWLEHALERKVEEVELEVLVGSERGCRGVVPKSLLKCPSIRRLKLALPLWKVVLGRNPVGLLNLRTLHLKGIQSCNKSLSDLFSACPVLEELHMEDCNFCHLKIKAKELKRLTITGCIFDTFNKLEIVTPKLLRFDYTSGKVQGCFVHDMPSLVNARIVLFNLSHSGSLWNVSEILKGLSNATSLTFTYIGNQVFTVEEHLQLLPMFLNLKYLRLNIVFSYHPMETIAYMVKHMPELKTLEIHNEMVMTSSATLMLRGWQRILTASVSVSLGCASQPPRFLLALDAVQSNADSSPEGHIRWTSKCLTAGELNGLEEIKLGNFGSFKQETMLINFLLTNGKIVKENNSQNPATIERGARSSPSFWTSSPV